MTTDAKPTATHDLVLVARRTILPDGERPACVVVDGQTITAITDADDAPTAHQRIEVPDDQVLMPGLVDSHVHVNEPGRTQWEGYETATRAGLAAGITTILDMPLNSSPPTVTVANLELKEEAARGKLSVDVGLWGGAVPGNTAELEPMWERGVFGFKCFTAHSGIDEYGFLDYGALREVLRELARIDAPLIVHAEDPEVLAAAPQDVGRQYAGYLRSRPEGAETAAISAVASAAKDTGARVHILHLSSAQALPIIRTAKADGVRLTVETCPHYLTFAAEEIPDGATEYKCAPPLRSEANRRRLWEALIEGTIDHVASDHSPCTIDLKAQETGDFSTAWGGVSSVQLGPAAVWTAGAEFGITLNDLVRWYAQAPAATFEVPGKGAIAVGNDADLVVMDPEATFTVDVHALEHRNPISPYQGRRLRGVVSRTILRGRSVNRRSRAGRLVRRR